jgi:hypothetical protein
LAARHVGADRQLIMVPARTSPTLRVDDSKQPVGVDFSYSGHPSKPAVSHKSMNFKAAL